MNHALYIQGPSKSNVVWDCLTPSPVSVGETNQFGCCGFSCADLKCKFKLHLFEVG